jgi:hypothetical protein
MSTWRMTRRRTETPIKPYKNIETKNQEDCRATSGDDITGVQGRKGIGPPFFTGSSATLSLTFLC